MKKQIIILAIITLVASGCGQSSMKKQADRNTGLLDSVQVYSDEASESLLALTARSGMAAEYDSLRHAIAFASEAMDLNTFPITEDGNRYRLDDDLYYNDVLFNKWGTGMQPFQSLLYIARENRHSDMAGLDKAIRRYGTLIKLLVPYEKYIDKGWDRIIVQLLTAYEDLSVSTDNFDKINDIMTDGEDNDYEEISLFARDKQMTAFISPKDAGFTYRGRFITLAKQGEVNTDAVIWAYSFWGRRYNENPDNVPHIASALKTIRELFANNQPPVADKNLPLIEPYLTSDIRPNEPLHPWKLYSDRVKVLQHYEGGDFYFIIVEKNGEEHWFLDNLDRDVVVNRGDIIDLTWDVGINPNAYFGDGVGFTKFVHSIKMIEEGATTQFHKKYGAMPEVVYINEEYIDGKTEAIMFDKLCDSLLTSKQEKITEALKIFSENKKRLRIEIEAYYRLGTWDGIRGEIDSYGIDLYLFNSDKLTDFTQFMRFYYDLDTDTFHIGSYPGE